MNEPTQAIFLSYASQDAEAARRIAAALHDAGLTVWLDQSELRGGDVWDAMIRRQISECALFIPVISTATAARLEGYFRLEWTLADQRTQRMARTKAFIVPVCIDATPESGSDVPDSFQRVQWSRLPGGATPPAFTERVRSLLGGNAARTATPAPAAAPATDAASAPAMLAAAGAATTPAPARRPPLLIGIVALVIAVAAVAYLRVRSVAGTEPGAGTPPTPPAVAPAAASIPAGPQAATAIPERSIAVLPFVDLSEKRDQEYFSDGLSEELLDLLAQVPDLHVAARTSSFFFKGKAEDVAAIGRKLRVAHVLEGSVRRAGSKVRVTAQLIRADNGYHLWSKTYDRDFKDIFQVQDEISAAVVDALKIQLLASRPLSNHHQTSNTEAYAQYLLGNQLRDQDTLDSNRQARVEYLKAISLDPAYAAAYSGLSDAEWRLADMQTNNPQDYARALSDAEKAIALAPDAPEGYWARGQIRNAYYYDWSGAQADFERALALDPADARAGVDHAQLLATLGRLPEAIDELHQVITRDPLSARAWRKLTMLLLDAGRFAEAREGIAKIAGIEGADTALFFSAQLALFEGRPADALRDFQAHSREAWRLIGTSMAQHSLGQDEESRRTLDTAIRKFGDALSYQYAGAFAWRGDKDEAFRRLERGFEIHDGGLGYLKHERYMASLRGDPRYAALLAKLHLPPGN